MQWDAFIVYLPTQYVLNFQLLGGIWIIQTLPAVFLGLFTRWFNRWALLVGWIAGMVAGTWLFVAAGLKSASPLFLGFVTIPAMYTAMTSVVLNLVLAVVLTPVFEALGARRGEDQTAPTDYDEKLALVSSAESGGEALS